MHLVCRRYPASRPPCTRSCVMTPSIVLAYQSSTAAHFHSSHLMTDSARLMAQLYLRSWIALPHCDMQTWPDNSTCRYFATIKVAACSKRASTLVSEIPSSWLFLIIVITGDNQLRSHVYNTSCRLEIRSQPISGCCAQRKEASILSTCTIIRRHHYLLNLSLHRALIPSKCYTAFCASTEASARR